MVSLKLERWWNENYHTRLIIKITYFDKLKQNFFRKISNNKIFCKCLIRTQSSMDVKLISGGFFDFHDVYENGYHVSIWLKDKDELLLSKFSTILSDLGLKNVMSMSDKRVHGFKEEKQLSKELSFELLLKLFSYLEKEHSYFSCSLENDAKEYEKIK